MILLTIVGKFVLNVAVSLAIGAFCGIFVLI